MGRPRVTRNHWWPVIAIGVALEALALRDTDHDGTLSRFTRWLFRVHTVPGKLAFTAGVVWFWGHIVRPRGSK